MNRLCRICREDLRVRSGLVEGAFRFVVTLQILQARIDMVVERRGQVRTQVLGFLRDDVVANRPSLGSTRPTVESVVAGEGRGWGYKTRG